MRDPRQSRAHATHDCAEAALMLLQRGRFGGDCTIAGPQSLSGDELAARLSAGLGRTIRYCAQALDDFEREIYTPMGAGVGRRVGPKFRFFAAHPHEADAILAAPFAPQPGLEGFVPTGVDAWIAARRDRFAAAATSSR